VRTAPNNVLQQWARLARAVLCRDRDERDHPLQDLASLNARLSLFMPTGDTLARRSAELWPSSHPRTQSEPLLPMILRTRQTAKPANSTAAAQMAKALSAEPRQTALRGQSRIRTIWD
jgi:hypothetical protein